MEHENLLVGYSTSDDCGVYRLDDERALVQSTDFFTPIVDDPTDFGAIAAANALSDIFAMGGQALTALSLVCFPYKTLDGEILAQINAGGAAKIAEAGAVVLGGHSVNDSEIKFGYAITGMVHPKRFWRNDTPKPGDALVLTKPLGTGLIATAVKQGKLPAPALDEPIAEMKRLNKAAAEAASHYQVNAATDITGFGLMGHLYEMLRGRGLGANIITSDLAVFDGVFEAIEQKALTGAHRTNREYTAPYNIIENDVLKKYGDILYDPQTSGGLLLALPMEQALSLFDDLLRSGHRPTLIGEVNDRGEICCA